MKSNVVYLNAWLNVPDDILRQNFAVQEKIQLAKVTFWYNIKVQGINEFQAQLCYDRFIHANRDNLKLIKPDPV
jgi:hypothetical protein